MREESPQNYFELFALPPSFEIDNEALALHYRELQREVHPDRFVHASESERLASVQLASRINEAFQTLSEPLSRARYLLEQRGFHIDTTNTQMDPMFLMEQMELREQLDAVQSASDHSAALSTVRDTIEERERMLNEHLSADFQRDTPESLAQARETVRKMQFMQRLLDETARIEEDVLYAE